MPELLLKRTAREAMLRPCCSLPSAEALHRISGCGERLQALWMQQLQAQQLDGGYLHQSVQAAPAVAWDAVRAFLEALPEHHLLVMASLAAQRVLLIRAASGAGR